MKRLLVSWLLPIAIIGCAKVDRNVSLDGPNVDTDTDGNRLAINSNSSTGQLNAEFRELNARKQKIKNLSEDILSLQKRIADDVADIEKRIDERCSTLDERAQEFNDELERRFPGLEGSAGALELAEGQMADHVEAEEHHRGVKAEKSGQRYAIERIANSAGSVRDAIHAERKVLRGARRVQLRARRQARQDIKESNYESPMYETAVASESAAELELKRIEASLEYFAEVKKKKFVFNKATELNKLPALDADIASADAAIQNEEAYLVDLRATRQTALREIAALPTVDNLKPIDLPPQCE